MKYNLTTIVDWSSSRVLAEMMKSHSTCLTQVNNDVCLEIVYFIFLLLTPSKVIASTCSTSAAHA